MCVESAKMGTGCFRFAQDPYCGIVMDRFGKSPQTFVCGDFPNRDPHRIQTCNLLIRSQMLYSVELAGLVYLLFVLYKSEFLLLDTSLLS